MIAVQRKIIILPYILTDMLPYIPAFPGGAGKLVEDIKGIILLPEIRIRQADIIQIHNNNFILVFLIHHFCA